MVMIDPDNIIIQRENKDNSIVIRNVPEFETEMYNLEDEKDYKRYIKDIKREVRRSFEYKHFMSYLRNYMGMDKCAFLKDVSNKDTYDIKIEIHHYPFTLEDIAEIVYRKRSYYHESLDLQMTAKEVMQLHYELVVGLISLSKTVHELYHSGRLFIPVDKVLGRYKLFVDYYRPFIDPEMIEALERIEKYTEEKSDILDTTILDQNKVTYNIQDKRFALPKFETITDNMINRIESIKNNNYLLPKVEPKKETVSPVYFEEKKEIIQPIYFEVA